MAQRLLVIEDHKSLLRSLERGLTAAGYDVVATDTGEAGFYCASTERFDGVVLDIMLPGRSGLAVLQELRNSGFSLPVLILSARDSVQDRVRGLDEGADDYLVKPFAFEELLARLRAMLNRGVPGRRAVLTALDLEYHVQKRQAVRGGRPIDLSKRESQLLHYLLRHKNQIVSRAAIAAEAWNEPNGISSNVVDVYINALRKKIERSDLPKLIHTIRGSGYSLRDDFDGPAPTSAEDTA